MRARRLLFALVTALPTVVLALLAGGLPPAAADDTVVITYFYGEECPYCQVLGPRLAALADSDERIRLDAFEVWHDAENRERFAETAAGHGVEPSGVPMTFVDGRVWVGFHEDQWAEMEATIGRLAEGRADASDAAEADTDSSLRVPLVGTVELADTSLLATTALIAFVDGFNPCSLWVLTVLLAMTLHARSRRRLVLVGGTFLVVTAAVYALFIAGLFSVLSYVSYLGWIQLLVAGLALLFALVSLKDFFWWKRGLSFTIPDRFKPRIYRESRALAGTQRSTGALIGATAALALGVALVELPCTAGFPAIWTNALAAQGVEAGAFVALLATYVGIYLLDEAVVFAGVVATMRIGRLQERHGRLLKLVGGMVMLALAVALLVRPELMTDLAGMVVVFAAALIGALVVAVLERARRSRNAGRPGAPQGAGAATRAGTGSRLPSAAARRAPASRSRARSRR